MCDIQKKKFHQWSGIYKGNTKIKELYKIEFPTMLAAYTALQHTYALVKILFLNRTFHRLAVLSYERSYYVARQWLFLLTYVFT